MWVKLSDFRLSPRLAFTEGSIEDDEVRGSAFRVSFQG